MGTHESLLFTIHNNPNKEINTDDYLTQLDNNKTLKDDEFYRRLYEETAMPSLEFEPPTPMQIQQLKKENKQLDERLRKIEESMMPVTRLYHELLSTIPERILSELKPDASIRNDEDGEQRIPKNPTQTC